MYCYPREGPQEADREAGGILEQMENSGLWSPVRPLSFWPAPIPPVHLALSPQQLSWSQKVLGTIWLALLPHPVS